MTRLFGFLSILIVLAASAYALDFGKFPLVRLVRADENSYCVEFKKTQTYFLRGPCGVVAQGSC